MLAAIAGTAASRGAGPSLPQAPPARFAPRLAVDFGAVLADGTPVGDLQPGEIEIRLNGHARKVLGLRRVITVPASAGAPGPGAGPGQLPAPYATNEGVPIGRSFVILVDELSFVAGRESLLRNSVEGLLRHLTPADRTLVLALPYGGVKAPFTADRERIRQAMASLIGQGERGETGSGMAERTRTFLETLQAFLQGQAGRRTPLTVILFTAGLAAPRRDAPMALPPGRGELLVDHFKWIGEAAGAARANFYVLAARRYQSGRRWLEGDDCRQGLPRVRQPARGHRAPGRRHQGAPGCRSTRRAPTPLARVALESSAYYVADLEPETPRGPRPEPADGRARDPPRRHGARKAPDHISLMPARRSASRPARGRPPGRRCPDRGAPARGGLRRAREPGPPSRGRARGACRLRPAPGLRRRCPRRAQRPGCRPLDGLRRGPAAAARRDGCAARHLPAPRRRDRHAGRAGAVDQVVELRLASVGPLSLGSLMLGVSRPEGVVAAA